MKAGEIFEDRQLIHAYPDGTVVFGHYDGTSNSGAYRTDLEEWYRYKYDAEWRERVRKELWGGR